MISFLIFSAVVVVLAALIIFWRYVASFLRAAISPKWNNRIFLILFVISLGLFINAVYQGGAGFEDLKSFFPKAKPDPATEYRRSFTSYILRGQAAVAPKVEPPTQTWRWVKWWLLSVVVVATYFPVAFWDEFVAARNRFDELWEQRQMHAGARRLITLPSPAPASITTPGPQPTSASTQRATLWQRIRGRFAERFAASFSADLIAGPIVELASGVARRILR